MRTFVAEVKQDGKVIGMNHISPETFEDVESWLRNNPRWEFISCRPPPVSDDEVAAGYAATILKMERERVSWKSFYESLPVSFQPLVKRLVINGRKVQAHGA